MTNLQSQIAREYGVDTKPEEIKIIDISETVVYFRINIMYISFAALLTKTGKLKKNSISVF